jgi:hypothetical protein
MFFFSFFFLKKIPTQVNILEFYSYTHPAILGKNTLKKINTFIHTSNYIMDTMVGL